MLLVSEKNSRVVTQKLAVIIIAVSCVYLAGCVAGRSAPASSPNIPTAEQDSGPKRPMDVSHIPDAVPRVEPITAAGNKSPYVVLGKTYRVMKEPSGYQERGIASWYGKKFHGRKTSNGEVYDMYGMTAAHKTLPIPSFVEVTNLKNNKKIIVRVNDRGPFHEGRVIDLTYAAAKKLDFQHLGTAQVKVSLIDPRTYSSAESANSKSYKLSRRNLGEQSAPAPENSAGYRLPDNTFLQAGAFSSQTAAENLRSKILSLTSYPVTIVPSSSSSVLYKVRVGPIDDNWKLVNLQETLVKKKIAEPYVVYE